MSFDFSTYLTVLWGNILFRFRRLARKTIRLKTVTPTIWKILKGPPYVKSGILKNTWSTDCKWACIEILLTKTPSFRPSSPPSNRCCWQWGHRCDPWVLKSAAHLAPLPHHVCPGRGLPWPGFSKGIFRISLFIFVWREERGERE